MKSIISLNCLCAFIVVNSAINGVNTADLTPNKLTVQVYYETLCPDSIHFITNQLYNAMTKDGLLQYTDLKFIPYGKVKVTTDPVTKIPKLSCQHGFLECELNALHGCVVHHNTVQEQLELINCLLQFIPLDTCGVQAKTNVTDAKECKTSRSTYDILKAFGKKTDVISIKFVPSIGIDGVVDDSEQEHLLYDFSKTFCRKYQEKFGILLKNC